MVSFPPRQFDSGEVPSYRKIILSNTQPAFYKNCGHMLKLDYNCLIVESGLDIPKLTLYSRWRLTGVWLYRCVRAGCIGTAHCLAPTWGLLTMCKSYSLNLLSFVLWRTWLVRGCVLELELQNLHGMEVRRIILQDTYWWT